jgi:hypothetical protein
MTMRFVAAALAGMLTIAVLGGVLYDWSQYGTTNLWTLRLTLVEPLITMIMVAAAGAVVALVLGGGSRRSG